MPGRRSSLPKKFIWICWRQLSGVRAQVSCGGNTSIYTHIAPSGTFVDCTWMVPRPTMVTLTEIHALPRGGHALPRGGPTHLDLVANHKPHQGVSPSAAIFESKAHVNTCCGTNKSFKSLVPFFGNNPGVMTDKATVLGLCNSLTTKLSTGRAGMDTFGGAVLRQQDVPTMESGARTVASDRKCSRSPKFWSFSSHSKDALFGSSTHNDYESAPAMKDSSTRASFRSKEGTVSNVARLRARAGGSEFAENLAVTPVEVIRPKVPVKDSLLSTRFMNPGAVPEFRLIHETAIVHPDALLGEGVEIGAFCTIGPQVKLGNGCKLQPSCHIFGDTQLGDNCVLSTGAVVGADIPGHTIIGDKNVIGHYAVVGVKCQDMKYKEGDECFLYIGNNNDIREFTSIHRSSKPNDNTVLGDNNLIMGSCHVAHDCKLGNGNILANGTLLGGHVVVEDLVHTGGGVAVHQFCNIGSYAFLAGGSMVDRDVPMYVMVAGDRAQLRGLNLEGMRRCGFSNLEIRSIRKAYENLFMNSANSGGTEKRLWELEQDDDLAAVPAVMLMLQSVRDCFGEKRRGICGSKHWATV